MMNLKPKDSKDSENFRYSLEEENSTLRNTLTYLREEIDKLRSPPLVVCEISSIFDDKAVVKLSNSNRFLVNVSRDLIGKIKPGDKVLSEQKSLNIVGVLDKTKKFNVENFVIIEKPNVSWHDIGGLKDQIREIKEVIELPLKNPKLFKEIGIEPPKGILLHGVPGSGKTLLARAVASSTNATFIQIVGSELVQKFIGEGAKLVKDIFQLAKEKGPSIIFIDELDSIAAERIDLGTSGEREVQRTFMQLLSEIDGFNNLGNVKVIGATNRLDIIDSAVLRPGRLDRLVEIPLPDYKGRMDIFEIHKRNMNLDNINIKKITALTEGFSGAEIKAVCTEAGYFAIRNKRNKVTFQDFLNAIQKISNEDSEDSHIKMFG